MKENQLINIATQWFCYPEIICLTGQKKDLQENLVKSFTTIDLNLVGKGGWGGSCCFTVYIYIWFPLQLDEILHSQILTICW